MQTQTQRTILWVIFSMSLLLLWDAWQQHNGGPSMFGPSQPVPAEITPTTGAASATGSAASGVPAGQTASGNDGAVPTANTTSAAGSVAPATTAAASGQPDAQSVELRNDKLLLSISTRGGVIRRAELLEHRDRVTDGNIVLFESLPGNTYLAQTGLINAPAGSQFATHHTNMTVVRSSPGELVLAAEEGGLKVERTYRLASGSYLLDLAETVSNVSEGPLSPVVYRQLTRDNHVPAGDDSFYIRTFVGPMMYTEEGKFNKIPLDDIADKSAEYVKAAADGWIGMMQHYFASAWIPTQGVARDYYTQLAGAGLYSIGMKEPLAPLGAGQSVTTTSQLFVGPQDQRALAKIAPGLELTIDYGFLTVLCKPIYWLLEKLHSIVGNWGWAIVLLTLIIKTIFFPLQAASYKSMARMKAVAPRLQAMKEKFGDDRAKMNQAMMELYKNEKINPLGGCLPILVQIPVFISLYWVLLASVEMRDAPWIGWIKDLQSPDPYYLLPLLMAISMFVQVRLNPTPPDPVQAKVMMAMPIIFSVMFFFFPAGLVLYWLVNNLYSIAQQWVITRKIVKG
ncbi:MAG: membrane protein insertase YidC [Burkholderiaceae bacterium]